MDRALVVRGSALATVLAACATAAGLLFSPSAMAVRGHVFSKSFGGGPCVVEPLEPCEGKLDEPSGVAANEASGDVYVVDKANNRVEYFSSEGVYAGEFNASGSNVLVEGNAAPTGQFSSPEAIAVDNDPASPSFGDVYVADVGHAVIDKFSATGAYIGQLAGTCENPNEDPAQPGACPGSASKAVVAFATILGVAVDRAGQLWVYQSGAEIDSFSAAQANEFLSRRENPLGFAAAPGLAVDSSDNLYVKNAFGEVAKLTSSGSIVSRGFYKQPGEPGWLAVDQSNDEVYVADADTEAAVARLTAAGSLLERFGGGEAAGPSGIAANAVTGEVLLADTAANRVDVFTLEPPAQPAIDSESVSQVSATSVRLEAQLNPKGLLTEYHFDYGLTTQYGTSVPLAQANAGSSFGDASFSLLLEGLTPRTIYHYRVVATNSLATVHGGDQTFTTQGGEHQGLLDGRAWEPVSPADKHGVSLEAITNEGGIIQAAEDGSAIAYVAKAPVDSQPQGNRSIADTQLLATRKGPGAWATQDIATPNEEVHGLALGKLSEYRLFSSDLSVGLLEPFGATPLSAQATERTPYRRDPSGSYLPLVNPGNVAPPTKFGGEPNGQGGYLNGVVLQGASADAAHVILASNVALTPEAQSNGVQNLYEWTAMQLTGPEGLGRVAGTLRLVSVLPGQLPAAGAANLGLEGRRVRGAVSTDGSRVFFEAEGGLFLRDLSRGETVQVDAPAPGAGGAAGGGRFQLATSDGSRVFFTDESSLTADAATAGTSLYMCEVSDAAQPLSCTLQYLSVPLGEGETADVPGAVIGADGAGRYVYFAASGALAAGAVRGDCASTQAAAACNLYVRDTVAHTTRLVAVLSSADNPDWGAGVDPSARDLGDLTGRVSNNGRWFAFMSQRPLTGFDNRDTRTGLPDEEVFLYDRFSGGAPICVSCASSGARPAGVFDQGEFPGLLADRPQLWGGHGLAGSIPGWTRADVVSASYQSRFLSDDGRLFFNSPVGLVAGDANARMDVYEYEPNGLGSCDRPAGCLGVVSSGSSGEESAFLDASASGEDVFFLTAAKLASTDTDNAFDVYDAHVCSAAAPCPPEGLSIPPACSTADSCRASAAPQPGVFGAPASAMSTGAGNVPPKLLSPAVTRLTRAQRLARALRACRTKPRRKRAACRARAHHRYGRSNGALPQRRQSKGKSK